MGWSQHPNTGAQVDQLEQEAPSPGIRRAIHTLSPPLGSLTPSLSLVGGPQAIPGTSVQPLPTEKSKDRGSNTVGARLNRVEDKVGCDSPPVSAQGRQCPSHLQ